MRRRERGDARHAAAPVFGASFSAIVSGDATDSDAAEWLAGYRIVRKLGAGSRATVYLGHTGTSSGVESGGEPGVASGVENTVALKVFEPHVSGESIDAEIDALTAASLVGAPGALKASGHVVRLLDVAMSPVKPRCLVLERLSGGSLAALLARAEPVSAGMAVTVLVSVIRALEQLHRAGFGHDHITPASVIIDDSGRPVLIGLGHVRRLPHQPDAAAAERAADYARLALLITRVFETVADALVRDRGQTIADWLTSLAGSDGDVRKLSVEEATAEIEDRLFALAQPRPLVAGPSRTAARGSAGDPLSGNPPSANTGEHRAAALLRQKSRARGGRPAEAMEQHDATETSAGAAPPRLGLRGVLVSISGGIPTGEFVQRVRTRVAALLRARRRPLIFGGAIGAALLVLVLALTPPGTAAGGAAAKESASGSSTGAQTAQTDAPPSPRSSDAAEGSDSEETAAAADDPVAATDALLARRRTCLRTVSLSCLSSVDQVASPMLDADQSLIGRLVNDSDTAPGEDYAGFAASLIQRSGGSALIALAPPAVHPGGDAGAATPKPASALVIEGETGWRLREIFTN